MSVSHDALTEYDFIVVIDASGSMSTEDMPGGRSRWQYMQETAESFCRDICKLDADGIGMVVFSGANVQTYDGVDANKVREVFQSRSPRGSTPLAEALTAAFQLAGKSEKKDFIIVFTDGEPDDKAAAARAITQQANKQANDEDLTILFVQVGTDGGATRYLKSLDDDLRGAKFDIVDVKTQAEAEAFASTADLVAAAIDD